MTKILIIVLCGMIGALAGEVYVLVRQRNYWRKSAMGNARGRILKDKQFAEERGQIQRKAAKEIVRLNAENQDLRDDIQRLRNINRNLLRQMDQRERNSEFRIQNEEFAGGAGVACGSVVAADAEN